MGKINDPVINSFSVASEDKRSKDFSKFSHTKHFEIHPHKLVPRFDSTPTVDEDTDAYTIVNFLYDQRSAGSYKLFGLGVVTGSSKAAVYYWDGSDWQAPANNESSIGAREQTVFFSYKGFAYMWKAGTTLIRFDLDSGDAFNDAYQAIAYTNVTQPVHHPVDDIAYFFSDNNVHTLNDTVWASNALVLPVNLKIVAACPYGNYLAIGCVTLDGTKSYVFLWDRDSSLTTLTDRYDFGTGEIVHLANLNNKLTAVMKNYPKLLIKQVSGQFGITVNELKAYDEVGGAFTMPAYRFVKDNRLYFPLDFDIDFGGSYNDRLGIWVVDSDGRIGSDFMIEGATSYKGFFNVSGLWYVAYNADGSVDVSNKSFSGTQASIYETLFVGESQKNNKLLSVGVMTESLPSSGQIVLKYRKKENEDWTTIFTYDTNNSYYHEAVNIESTGATLPQFREIQFRVESTGGAVVTGLKIKYEEVDSNPN